ncbi:putative mitochondrial protein [Cucumis melo var. makuwa]|uniref:Mitochondrial protein n=1 Tax=Cucumis melo var. makuwa TaxID=1194695 RepID=A0A5A7ULN2_CUCMM|nr:putative mitochondrial protein [Cucumis melo var. makuwa]TYK08967.1 putative mitochondrial protein [Cucumis melo var. makuwa]
MYSPTYRPSSLENYRRNLIKEVGSLTVQSTSIHDSEPLRDQGMIDSIYSYINNRMSENNRSEMNFANTHIDSKVGEKDGSKNNGFEAAVPEDMVEKGSVDEVITDREDGVDENEVIAESTKNKTNRTILETLASMIHLLIFLLRGGKSPRAWFDRFTTFIKSHGYNQRHSNHTLFIKVSKARKMAVMIVYVDDIVLSGDDVVEIIQLKKKMGDEFEIKDMKVARSRESISMS